MTTEERLAALEAQIAALVEPPTEYYTSRYSGEEIDKGIDGALQLGGASTPQGAIAALGAGVRPKLNDNPFFLVNQRGQSSYTGPSYGPDRWLVTGSHKLDMLDGGGVKLTVVSGSNANQMIQQYLEPEIFERLNGKQVTLAVIVTENSMSLPTYFMVGNIAYGNIPAGQTGLFFATATINYNTGQNYIGLQCSDRANQNGQSISLRAFTMEEGSIQTLGYQDSSGVLQLLERPDPLELLKCQRYQRVISAIGSNLESPFFSGYISASQKTLYISIPLAVPMRTTPSVSINNATITIRTVSGYSPYATYDTPGNLPSAFARLSADGGFVNLQSNLPEALGENNTPCTASLRSGRIILDANL